MTPLEFKRYTVFYDKHNKCYSELFKAKQSKPWGLTLKLRATGIGIAVTVKCYNCKEEEDITDYGSW